ncbi:MAG: hypothetical protein ACR2K4_10555 [Candidatus Limnocylindria bacterium]
MAARGGVEPMSGSREADGLGTGVAVHPVRHSTAMTSPSRTGRNPCQRIDIRMASRFPLRWFGWQQAPSRYQGMVIGEPSAVS